MIIDFILDRRAGVPYDAKKFYDYVRGEEDVFEFDPVISRAMDGGSEEDVKKALCRYIVDQGYNDRVCDYINSVDWLGEYVDSARKPIKSSINTEIVEDFPAYMVYYATYGEPGGNNTDEDIAAFEKWRKRKGYGDCLGFVDDDPEQSFDSHPAFGLACDTVPVIFEVEKSIESSRKAIKSAFSLSESERDGLSLVIGYITGIYGDDEDVAKYEAVRNSLSEDELKELENLLRYVIDAKQDVKVVKETNLKKDIPLLNKVYGILDENDLLDDSDAWYGFKKLESSRRPIKSGLGKETVSVDVNSLYHFLTDSETAEVEGDFALVRCDEDDGETYYDILSDGDLACMDGETCEIVGRGEGFVELHSIEADDGVNFKLSPEEFEVACGKSKKEIKSSLTSDSFERMIDESRKMAKDMDSKLEDWWVTSQVGQDVVYFVAEHKDYSVRVRFEFVDSGFCYVSKTYTNGSYYEPVALESWKYEGLSSQEIEGKMTAVLNDFFPKYNEIGSSKKPVESSVDYEPLTKLLDDLGAYPENRMPPAGIYKRLLDWKVGSEGMNEKEARNKFGTFTVGEWIDDLKESVM
jgi:hypothetical protein